MHSIDPTLMKFRVKLAMKNYLLEMKSRNTNVLIVVFIIFNCAISTSGINDRIKNVSSIETSIKKKTSHPLAFQLNSLSTFRRKSRDICHQKDQLLNGVAFYLIQEKIKPSMLVLNETNEKKRSLSRAGTKSKKKEISRSKNPNTKGTIIFCPINSMIALLFYC